jgi:hypothetical protein
MSIKNEQVMVDIETMGTGPYACVTAIGAVIFEDGKILKQFYTNVEWGGEIDKDTVQWWLKQDKAAQDAMFASIPVHIIGALVLLLDFAGGRPIWGNGVDFDNVILANAAKNNCIKWPYRQNRCFRTFKNVFPVEYVQPVVSHNALHDAIAQAEQLMNICNNYNISLK